MPAGMRKTTRVFGTRVLRSGRRLSTETREGSKYSKVTRGGGNDWIGLVDKSDEGGGNAASNSIDRKYVKRKAGKLGSGTPKAVKAEPMIDESVTGGVIEIKDRNLMFGAVYERKRKRTEFAGNELLEDNRFGKKFARKQWRKKIEQSEALEVCEDVGRTVNRRPGLAILARESSCSNCHMMTRFLTSVLRYMMRIRLGIRQLSAFVLSKPIFDVYYSRGLLFLQGSNNINSRGVCIISGSRSLLPIFSVDYSAIPICFVNMHTSMYIRSLYLFCFVAQAPRTKEDIAEIMGLEVEMADVVLDVTMETPEIQVDGYNSEVVVALPTFPDGDRPDNEMIGTLKNKSNKGKELTLPSVGLRKYSLRSNLQLRNSRNIQKRRTSLRRKKGRPNPVFRAQKDSGALSADFLRIRNVNGHIPSAAPTRTVMNLVKRDFTTVSPKALKSNLGMLKQGVRTNSCSTNLLIIEPDRCYRVEGATIALEQSETKQWFLAVKINGTNRYTLTANKVMRPPGSNRFSHATVWGGDGSWKLEFPDKQDWLIFKDLYKECSDLNIQTPAASVIPIPKVQEVSLHDDCNYVPYVRPDSYITVKGDELTRALGKNVANYDMDSEDEEWLNKFNEDLFSGGHLQQLTHERFELIIDAFERSMHCSGDDYSNEQAAEDIFTPIEAVRSYWMKKRKNKHCSVIRIFQLYQPRKNPVISKPILRKRRSFKRQPSQGGRGKHRNFLQAIVEERNAHAQQKYVQNVEEAKAAADRSEELAVQKRLWAQKLMENADLATYKAVIALRIAEAAQVTESPSTVASFFLG